MLLVRSERNRQVVAQMCHHCQRCGVRLGMSVAHARALLSGDVVVQPHEPAKDEAALHALARWGLRFTPIVQADPPDGLLLDIAGCEHLYGGTRAMLHHVIEQVSRLGLQVRSAIGPTLGCAWALARFGQSSAMVESLDEVPDALAPLPVQSLRIEREIEEALRAVAIETVEQLMQLPRASLVERFGSSLLLRLDQALGEAFEPVQPVRPQEPMRVERVFDGPVKQLEAILHTGRELIEELCQHLAGHEAGVRQLRLDLQRIDAADQHETLTLSRPSRDARHLWLLLRPRLERVHMGFGIERMVLHATAVGQLAHQQDTCGDWRHDVNKRTMAREIGELTDRLCGRFGSNRVLMLEARATHVPERAFAHRAIDQPQHQQASRHAIIHADRPTLLDDRPQPVQVIMLSPDGPVMAMHWANQSVRIITTIGPERITPRWWLTGMDDRRPAPRDYFKVQDAHGRWWWLYRHAGTSRWFVHGRWR